VSRVLCLQPCVHICIVSCLSVLQERAFPAEAPDSEVVMKKLCHICNLPLLGGKLFVCYSVLGVCLAVVHGQAFRGGTQSKVAILVAQGGLDSIAARYQHIFRCQYL
jgi:hypothetical protein